MLSRETLHQRHIVRALIVGALVQLLLHAADALGHLLDVAEGLLSLLTHGGRVLQHHHLWQIAHGHFLLSADRTRRGALLSAEYLEHGGFARTVFAY